jgi:hypothetical protein
MLRIAGSVMNTATRTVQFVNQKFKTTHSYLFEDRTTGGEKTEFFNLLGSTSNLRIRKAKCWDSPPDIIQYNRAKKNSPNSTHLQHCKLILNIIDQVQKDFLSGFRAVKKLAVISVKS